MAKTPFFLVCFLCMMVPRAGLSYETDFLEPPPDSMITLEELGSTVHLYGPPHSGEFDIAAAYPWFANIFNLYVSDLIPQQWDSTDVAALITGIMDSDSTNSDDMFPRIWEYFCFGDHDPRYDHVSFTIGSTNYSKINIVLYHHDDLCITGREWACHDYGWYAGSNQLFMSGTHKDRVAGYVHSTFSHELQHLCFEANGLQISYDNIDESLAKCAEHTVKAYQYYSSQYHPVSPVDKGYEVSYDASIYRGERCDPEYKYLVEEMWTGYLYDVFRDSPNNISDDLVYRWLRKYAGSSREISMHSLAEVLTSADYSWLGGTTGNERLRNLFQCYAIAKFCNAPEYGEHGQFGYDEAFSPIKNMNMFLDVWPPNPGAQPQLPVDCPGDTSCGHPGPCGGSWNVRIVPPSYVLGIQSENVLREVAGIYTDGDDTPDPNDGDGSRDYIDIATYGTDYIEFKAGAYFQDGACHELHFSLVGEEATPPPNCQVKMWVVGYNSTQDTLQLHPEDIIFIRPVSVNPDSTKADVVVTDFGRSIKSVVVVITLVETTPSSATDLRYFTYGYRYGAYTVSSANVTWNGDVFVPGDIVTATSYSLTMEQGTHVHVAPTDYSHSGADTTQIEWDIWGNLSINGSAAKPVIVESWAENPQPGDWAGIRKRGSTGSASVSYCNISDAYHGIKSYRPLQASHCNITNCEVHGIYLEGSGAGGSQITNCTTNANGSCGIMVNSCNNVSISYCSSNDDYDGIWLTASSNGSIAHTMAKSNACNGVQASSSRYAFDWCTVESNDQQGIYLSQSSGTVSNTKIWKNTANGLYCVGASSNPAVDHSKIEQNDTGVRVSSGGCPVLGDADLDCGEFNSIYDQPTFVYGSSSYTIKAENCWWGTGPGELPNANKIKGLVDFDPWLQSDPIPQMAPGAPRKPETLVLQQNFPNPTIAPGITRIMYAIPPEKSDQRVRLTIYDVSGRRVGTLVDGAKATGKYEAYWDGRGEKGQSMPPGIYFYKLTVGTSSITKKLILIR